MKKKMIALGITGILLGGTLAGVYASGVLNNETGEDGGTESAKNSIAQLVDNVTNTVTGQNLSKFEQMLQVMDETIENPIEYNDILFNYEYLKQVHQLSQEQLDYLSGLIIQGNDAFDVMDAAFFWTDTNEDISIVGQICALKGRYDGHTWIENAFNKVTNNKCGVLDVEDVNAYLQQGLTTADISTANKLCRKGVLTIQEILEQRLAGKSFAEITAQINGETLPQQMIAPLTIAAEPNNAEAAGTAEAETDGTPSPAVAQEAIAPQQVLAAENLNEITGEPLSAYYQKALEGVSLEAELEEKEQQVEDEINDRLKTQGRYKTVTKADKEAYLAGEVNGDE